MRVSLNLGHDPLDSCATKARPHPLGLAAAPVTESLHARIQPRLPTCRAVPGAEGRTHRAVRNEIGCNDYDVQKCNAKVAVEGTLLNLLGAWNG